MSGGLLLTDEERQRFAEWLEMEARSAAAMAQQLGKVGPAVGEALSRKERLYAAAATLIARRLRETESFSVGGGW